MNKIEKPGYRHYVHFTLKWIVVHLGAMLIQSFFAGYFAQSVYDEKIYHAQRVSLLISLAVFMVASVPAITAAAPAASPTINPTLVCFFITIS